MINNHAEQAPKFIANVFTYQIWICEISKRVRNGPKNRQMMNMHLTEEKVANGIRGHIGAKRFKGAKRDHCGCWEGAATASRMEGRASRGRMNISGEPRTDAGIEVTTWIQHKFPGAYCPQAEMTCTQHTKRALWQQQVGEQAERV